VQASDALAVCAGCTGPPARPTINISLATHALGDSLQALGFSVGVVDPVDWWCSAQLRLVCPEGLIHGRFLGCRLRLVEV
jgi:hypothetical protein